MQLLLLGPLTAGCGFLLAGGSGQLCSPGEMSRCACAGGAEGEASCLSSGASYSSCRCGAGAACTGSTASVTGTLRTSEADLAFTSVTIPTVEHKVDVDVFEDGCIAKTVLELRASTSGCTLRLELGRANPNAAPGGLRSISLNADSFCPGFPDAKEGLYESAPGYAAWWAGPTHVGQRQAASACVPGARYVFPDKPLRLTRSDGLPLTINLKDLAISASVYSVGLTSQRCVSATACATGYRDAEGWCAQNSFTRVPSGTVEDLKGLWGSGPNDVWAVGSNSTLLRWNGVAWSSVAAGGSSWLTGVWGSGPNDVWAVGSPTILHWNGSTWTGTMASQGLLSAVWGSGPSNVFAVGQYGKIQRWNGSSWGMMTSGTSKDLHGIWGSGPTDVWAVGSAGTILHWDGSVWRSAPSGSAENLSGVWGSGPSDVWAAGSATVLHWNGTAWSAKTGIPYGSKGLWGAGRSEVWAAGSSGVSRWDGSSWASEQGAPTSVLQAVWGSGSSEVWAVGRQGTIVRLGP